MPAAVTAHRNFRASFLETAYNSDARRVAAARYGKRRGCSGVWSFRPFAPLLQPRPGSQVAHLKMLPRIRLPPAEPKIRRRPLVKPGVNADNFGGFVRPKVLVRFGAQQEVHTVPFGTAGCFNEHGDVNLTGREAAEARSIRGPIPLE